MGNQAFCFDLPVKGFDKKPCGLNCAPTWAGGLSLYIVENQLLLKNIITTGGRFTLFPSRLPKNTEKISVVKVIFE